MLIESFKCPFIRTHFRIINLDCLDTKIYTRLNITHNPSYYCLLFIYYHHSYLSYNINTHKLCFFFFTKKQQHQILKIKTNFTFFWQQKSKTPMIVHFVLLRFSQIFTWVSDLTDCLNALKLLRLQFDCCWRSPTIMVHTYADNDVYLTLGFVFWIPFGYSNNHPHWNLLYIYAYDDWCSLKCLDYTKWALNCLLLCRIWSHIEIIVLHILPVLRIKEKY